MVLSLESVNKKPLYDIQMKAIEQYFPVVLFITLRKTILAFKFMDKNFKV